MVLDRSAKLTSSVRAGERGPESRRTTCASQTVWWSGQTRGSGSTDRRRGTKRGFVIRKWPGRNRRRWPDAGLRPAKARWWSVVFGADHRRTKIVLDRVIEGYRSPENQKGSDLDNLGSEQSGSVLDRERVGSHILPSLLRRIVQLFRQADGKPGTGATNTPDASRLTRDRFHLVFVLHRFFDLVVSGGISHPARSGISLIISLLQQSRPQQLVY